MHVSILIPEATILLAWASSRIMTSGLTQFSEHVQSSCFSLKVTDLQCWTHPEFVILDGADQRIVASGDKKSHISRIPLLEKTILYLHTELNYGQVREKYFFFKLIVLNLKPLKLKTSNLSPLFYLKTSICIKI